MDWDRLPNATEDGYLVSLASRSPSGVEAVGADTLRPTRAKTLLVLRECLAECSGLEGIDADADLGDAGLDSLGALEMSALLRGKGLAESGQQVLSELRTLSALADAMHEGHVRYHAERGVLAALAQLVGGDLLGDWKEDELQEKCLEDLGLDSLGAVELAAQLQQCGYQLPVQSVDCLGLSVAELVKMLAAECVGAAERSLSRLELEEGTIEFLTPVDLTSLEAPLARIVHGQVELLAEPLRGLPARVTLKNIAKPEGFSGEEFVGRLRAVPLVKHVDYDAVQLRWTFLINWQATVVENGGCFSAADPDVPR
jgi:acyl carrier protein